MRSNLSLSILLTLLLIVLLISQQFKSNSSRHVLSNESVSEDCHLRFGWGEWRPLHYYADDGNLVGLQIDFLRAVAEEMDCEISFPNYATWNDLLDGIRSGSIDIVGNATVTDERISFAHFSDPYRTDVFAIYVLPETYEKFYQMDLNSFMKSGFRLGLIDNFLYGKEIDGWRNNPQLNKTIQYSHTIQDSYQLLLNHEIDGLIDDPFIVYFNMQDSNITEDIKSLPFRTFGLPVSYMFSKKSVSPEVIQRFNIALKNVMSMPQYHSIWIKPRGLK